MTILTTIYIIGAIITTIYQLNRDKRAMEYMYRYVAIMACIAGAFWPVVLSLKGIYWICEYINRLVFK